MLVELPIWIIKHEENLFLCISEPSAFYRHFVRPIPVFLGSILQNLKGRSGLDNFFENDPLDQPKKMPPSRKFYLFRKSVKNAKAKVVIKIEFTPFPCLQNVSLLKGF